MQSALAMRVSAAITSEAIVSTHTCAGNAIGAGHGVCAGIGVCAGRDATAPGPACAVRLRGLRESWGLWAGLKGSFDDVIRWKRWLYRRAPSCAPSSPPVLRHRSRAVAAPMRRPRGGPPRRLRAPRRSRRGAAPRRPSALRRARRATAGRGARRRSGVAAGACTLTTGDGAGSYAADRHLCRWHT